MLHNITNDIFNSSLLLTHLIPSRFGTIVGAITAFVFCLFGVFGNLLILAAILRTSAIRNNIVNIFIVSLQINDIWNLCFNQLQVGLAYTFQRWITPWSCEPFVYSSIICTGSLLWHHALISIHRYLVVVRKQKNSFIGMSPKCYITLLLILTRLIPTLVCLPSLLNGNMTVYSPTALRCLLAPSISGFQNLLIVIFNMFVPCIIVLYCFIGIYRCVRKSGITRRKMSTPYNCYNSGLKAFRIERGASRTPEENNDRSQPKENLVELHNRTITYKLIRREMRREIKLSRMFGTIILVFLFGFLPYGIIRGSDKNNNLDPDVYVALTNLFIVSISISPLIYGLMNNQIRTQCSFLIKLIFCPKSVQKTQSPKSFITTEQIQVSSDSK